MRVTVWGENVHERRDQPVRAIYPDGMHETIAAGLRELLGGDAEVRTATLAGARARAHRRTCSTPPTC